MRIYECPECGNQIEGKTYLKCGYHAKNNGMYEVLALGSSKWEIGVGKGIEKEEISILSGSVNAEMVQATPLQEELADEKKNET